MDEIMLVGILTAHRNLAIPLSLLIEIIIAVSGVLPSVFITAANIAVFGLYWGTALSIAGESLGAMAAFILYRKGFQFFDSSFKRLSPPIKEKIDRISSATGGRAFWLVFSFRLFPYIPSGVVTAGAAVSRMRLFNFTLASSLGKVPALMLEVLSVSAALKLPVKGFLLLLSLLLLLWLFISLLRKKRQKD